MSKSLVAILHYNSTQYTDVLFELLKPYENDEYDLIVIDNGSDEGKTSKYSTFRLEENVYYGGGLDVTMDYFINNKQYDSMLLLNSDMIIHGQNFVKSLRKELFNKIPGIDLMAVSGCVLQPEKNQCHWKTIHNWGHKNIRYVPWVDYQCVLLKRELVEAIGSFGSKFGWVQDVMTGIICEDNNWKIGVCDWLPTIHFSNGSVKDNSDNPIISNYNKYAEEEMINYFQAKNLWDRFLKLREKAEKYEAYE
jgi:GT2 family glycosyltransferase